MTCLVLLMDVNLTLQPVGGATFQSRRKKARRQIAAGPPRLTRRLALRRERIVTVAVFVADLAVLVMNHQLGALVVADDTCAVNRLLFRVEMAGGAVGTALLDVPASLRGGNNVSRFAGHGRKALSGKSQQEKHRVRVKRPRGKMHERTDRCFFFVGAAPRCQTWGADGRVGSSAVCVRMGTLYLVCGARLNATSIVPGKSSGRFSVSPASQPCYHSVAGL